MNRTLLQILKTLTETQKSNWKESLNKSMFAYNSPLNLLSVRSPRLPNDMFFRLNTPSGSSEQHVRQMWINGSKVWRKLMPLPMKMLRRLLKEVRDTMTQTKSSALQFVDHLLVKNLTPRGGPGRNYWEEIVHKVKRQMGYDLPIY